MRTGRHTRTEVGVVSSVRNATRRFANTSCITRNVTAADSILKLPLREISVVLVDDLIMSQVHRRFMNQPGPTDVLTFPLEMDSGGKALSGEIVICLPEATRRAKIEGIPVKN